MCYNTNIWLKYLIVKFYFVDDFFSEKERYSFTINKILCLLAKIEYL